MLKKKNRGVYIILLLIIGTTMYFCQTSEMFENFNVNAIKEYINSFGIFAPIVYIIMFTLVPLTLFPDSILALAGGMVFGVFWGGIYTIIGAACGGSIAFFISRYLGRGMVEKLIKHKLDLFENGVEKKGFLLVIILRLIPLIPFDIISYGAGLSKIKYNDFILGTMIGIIPGVFIYANLGDKVLDLNSIHFFKAVAPLVVLFLISYIVKKKISFKDLQEKISNNKALSDEKA